MDFDLYLKIMFLSPAWYGKPYWKYLKVARQSSFFHVTWSRALADLDSSKIPALFRRKNEDLILLRGTSFSNFIVFV